MIRKLATLVQETHTEAGQTVRPLARKAAAVAVVGKPFAGRFETDLSALIALGEELGRTRRGAGAEHQKAGGMGSAIDVPLGHKDAAYVRSHFDAMEVRLADAPRRDEILVAVVVTDSGRPLPRVGGLQTHEIEGKDGLR